jgi:hypothetical protein
MKFLLGFFLALMLLPGPTIATPGEVAVGGVLREAAETLKQRTEDPALGAAERRRAEAALVQLFLMTRSAGAMP